MPGLRDENGRPAARRPSAGTGRTSAYARTPIQGIHVRGNCGRAELHEGQDEDWTGSVASEDSPGDSGA